MTSPAQAPGRSCALIVDSGAGLEDATAHGTTVIPLRLDIGGELYRDGVDISLDEAYARLAAGEQVRTSTPSPGEYLEAFRAADAERIICLTIPASLSAMHGSARLAAQLLADEGDSRHVDVVDARTAAAGFGLVARAAARLVDEGAPADEVLARVDSAAAETRMVGTLRTLGYLARSGRVPRLIAGLGDLVGVRPIFELSGGEAHRLGLVRGERSVLRSFQRAALDRVDGAEPIWLLVCHAAAPADAAAVREALHAVLTVARSETVALSPVLGTYTGPGMTGFAVMPLRDGELDEVP
jgi:fatty acid kinase fatty acid binding subunit